METLEPPGADQPYRYCQYCGSKMGMPQMSDTHHIYICGNKECEKYLKMLRVEK